MKFKLAILLLIALAGWNVPSAVGQNTQQTHATFSSVTTGNHGGQIFKVEAISSEGICATVRFIESQLPGGHRQALVDYEEHISIPILSQNFEYISAVNQFGDPVSAVFFWQGRIYESAPCPILYIVPPPSTVLYEAPGAQPMVNTSNRAEVTPESPAIAGFVLGEASWVVVRGIGPSMEIESEYIEDPVITLHADQYLYDDLNDDLENSITNDNWQDTLRKDTLEYWEMTPGTENESALVTYLNPGTYTVHLSTKGESGEGLVEVYIAPYALLPSE